jgi:hypothetical protein
MAENKAHQDDIEAAVGERKIFGCRRFELGGIVDARSILSRDSNHIGRQIYTQYDARTTDGVGRHATEDACSTANIQYVIALPKVRLTGPR